MGSKGIPVVLVGRCIIQRKDGKVLLVRRSLSDSHNPGRWEFPGGKVERSQNVAIAQKDEIRQETNLVVEIVPSISCTSSKIIGDGKYKGMLYVQITSIAKVVSGEVQLSHEHCDKDWVDPKKILQKRLTSDARMAAKCLSSYLCSVGAAA